MAHTCQAHSMTWVWIVAAAMVIAGVACIIIGTPLGRPLRAALRERRARRRATGTPDHPTAELQDRPSSTGQDDD